MSYRRLVIDGHTYEYVVGRRFVKIRGHRKVIPLSECGERFGNHLPKEYVVTPGTLKEYLTTGKVTQPSERICKKHNKPMMLYANPFTSEIYGKQNLMHGCVECFEEVALEI